MKSKIIQYLIKENHVKFMYMCVCMCLLVYISICIYTGTYTYYENTIQDAENESLIKD